LVSLTFDQNCKVASMSNKVLRGSRSLVRIEIPPKVTSIGSEAFAKHNANAADHVLEELICTRSTAPILGSSPFLDLDQEYGLSIVLPTAYISNYNNQTTWANYKTQFVGGGEYYAFN
jgi:hypothetical protein